MSDTYKRLLAQCMPLSGNDSIGHRLTDDDRENIKRDVAEKMQGVLAALCIDTANDHNTRGTAERVAKMMVDEIYRGRFHPEPAITVFPNAGELDELYCTGPITVRSSCSHHMAPIVGKAWIGLIPGEFVLGLSKFNRIVDHICSRPQIQEEMVVQVVDAIERIAKPKGLAVVIKARHMCMTWRGVREHDSAVMTTSVMRGLLKDIPSARQEFLTFITEK